MKYIIYCRRSSEDTKQSQSLETQLNILHDFVVRNNLEVVDKIVESKSAKEDGIRTGFTELLNRIAKGDADGILVAHIDRLSRNGTDSAKLTKLLTSGKLKAIRTPSKVYDTSKDILMMEIELAMAAEYSRNLGIRIKEGNANKLRKGGFVGWAPIGYVNRDGKIVPDPKRAKFIRQAFELFAQGSSSLKELSSRLYGMGLRSRGGRKVGKSQIHLLLHNPVYYGAVTYAGSLYKGIHRPLISKSLYDRVQNVFKQANRSKKQKHDFLYRDYLSCGNCGCKLTATLAKGRYRYYYCTNGKHVCSEHKSYMSEDYVFNLILDNFKSIKIDRDLLNKAVEVYSERMSVSSSSLEDRKIALKADIASVQKKIDRLIDLHLEGEIDKETFANKRTRLNEEKMSLEEQLLHQNSESLNSTFELVKNWKNQLFTLEEMFATKDKQIQSDLLKSVLSNLKIQNKKVLSYQYKLPFSYLQNMPEKPVFEDWLPGKDSNLKWVIQSHQCYRYTTRQLVEDILHQIRGF